MNTWKPLLTFGGIAAALALGACGGADTNNATARCTSVDGVPVREDIRLTSAHCAAARPVLALYAQSTPESCEQLATADTLNICRAELAQTTSPLTPTELDGVTMKGDRAFVDVGFADGHKGWEVRRESDEWRVVVPDPDAPPEGLSDAFSRKPGS